jgi:perosamine synthetase
MRNIILAQPLLNIKKINKIFNSVIKSNFINEGKQTRVLESKIFKLLNVRYAVATTSGTASLFLALKAAGIRYGDEVIIPNLTFPATANAVKMAGGKVVLADVNTNDLLMNEKSLKNKISSKTKFVIPVHISGRGNNIKNIKNICKMKSIKVIEDAAEAFFSKFNGKNLGTYGIAGCFSFAPNKIITSGQGGMIVTNNKNIFKKLKRFKDQGREDPTTGGEDNYVSLGFNFKFTNVQASLLLSQLEDIKWRIKKLKQIYNFYKNNIIQNNKFKIIGFDIKNGELPLWVDAWCENRNKLFNFLKSKNIICRYFWKSLNTCKPYKTSFTNLSNSKKLQKKLIWLPSSLNMTKKEQKKVCESINLFFLK